jgi:subtilisin family serine protease
MRFIVKDRAALQQVTNIQSVKAMKEMDPNAVQEYLVNRADMEIASIDLPTDIALPNMRPSVKHYVTLADAKAFARVTALQQHNPNLNGKDIKIAIIDTGIDVSHPTFNGKTMTCKNFVKTSTYYGTDKVTDLNGHGTHCASIACGVGTTGSYAIAAGVAPAAQLYVGKALNDKGVGEEDDIAEAILWAVEEEVHVISLSLGGHAQVFETEIERACKLAAERGIVVVVAAGNEGPMLNTISTPGILDEVITVGACNNFSQVARFSSRGSQTLHKPDIVAPGVNVKAAAPVLLGSIATLSGTSMATPLVAGICALKLQQARTRQNTSQMKAFLKKTARKLPHFTDEQQGSGAVDALAIDPPLTGVPPPAAAEPSAVQLILAYLPEKEMQAVHKLLNDPTHRLLFLNEIL